MSQRDDIETSSPLKEHLTQSQLKDHLSQSYGLEVSTITSLDLNVYLVLLDGSTDSWVARVFRCPSTEVEEEVRVVQYLRKQAFPTEIFVNENPLSTYGPDICVLTTQYVSGDKPQRNRVTFRRLGSLLGTLHATSLPTAFEVRQGGAWHHLCRSGGVKEEIRAAADGLRSSQFQSGLSNQQEKSKAAQLLAELEKLLLIDFDSLPKAIVHPDLVPSNVIASAPASSDPSDPEMWTVIDWANVGLGSRLISLAPLLAAAAAREKLVLVHAVMTGYCSKIVLTPFEIDDLTAAICLRPLTIGCWEILYRKKAVSEVFKSMEWWRAMALKIAETVRAGLEDRQRLAA